MNFSIVLTFILANLTLGMVAADTTLPLKDYKLAGFSRPCCVFAINETVNSLGISKIIDIDDLGDHQFARENKQMDKVGMVYTCSAGFLDVSHLRDNADWSAHIFYNLPQWLGSGKNILSRREGGFKQRSVLFPKLSQNELASLTENDLEELAVSIGYNLALLHEIPTAFKIAVSSPSKFFIYEQGSAFSIEDAYSNLLGNKLGAQVAKAGLPFNETMTSALKEKLIDLKSVPKQDTISAFEMVRNEWWLKGRTFNMKHVLRRDFTYQGSVAPRLISDAPFCASGPAVSLSIPDKLSNGKSVDDYYQIQGVVSPKLQKALKDIGVTVGAVISQKEFPVIIEAIKKDLVRTLGPVILKK